MITISALTAALLLAPLAASAAEDKPTAKPAPAIELGAPFGDNMILQLEMEDPIWGWSKPGRTITVEFAGQKESAKAGERCKVSSHRMKARDQCWLSWLTLIKLEDVMKRSSR